MTVPPKEMQIVSQRIATFQQPHQLSKRRASSQGKKKGANTVEWPHARPEPEALARAGFFYRPAHDSIDNVQCFLCTVKLDGWEPEDDPIQEHLAHSNGCAWATALSVWRDENDPRGQEMRDPLSDEMVAARTDTFSTGDGWPHEGKKGWKCKTTKLVEAGWAWDPAAEGEDGDGATCFYCNLSLDGWEPKDDPFLEHKRRVPDCRFFELLEYYHGPEAAAGKAKKAKSRSKAGARASTTSKASRVSVQSVMSEAPSMPGSFVDTLRDSSLSGADDSVLTTATTASQATTAGTKAKKGGRKKAATTGSKGKKKTVAEPELEEEPELQDTDPATQQTYESSQLPLEEVSAPPPKATRKGTRNSKQVDSSVIEISQIETMPAKKSTRGRKPKVQEQIEPAPMEIPQTPDAVAIAEKRLSEVSAQLQEELEHSVDNFAPMDESTPVAQLEKPKRGTKRTSDGLRKQPEIESSVTEVHVSEQPAKRPRGRPKKSSTGSASAASVSAPDEGSQLQPKRPRGRPKKNSGGSTSMVSEATQAEEQPIAQDVSMELGADDMEIVVKPVMKKGKGKAKGKKASSTRSSKNTVTAEQYGPSIDEPEDLARDEMEIEQELERIASEQAAQGAITAEQDQVEQYETSPSQGRVSKDSAELQKLQDEVQAEEQDDAAPAPQEVVDVAPSPNGSDKENRPSPVTTKKVQPSIILSPTKTTRIPLAASTPNRSPGKGAASPSKQISHLTSTAPWTAVDLDTALLASPQPTPGRLGQQLVNAAGALTSPEKRMTVEEWVRHRAEKSEEDFRRRCEEMVASFEKEGMRGLESLRGINVVA